MESQWTDLGTINEDEEYIQEIDVIEKKYIEKKNNINQFDIDIDQNDILIIPVSKISIILLITALWIKSTIQ